MDKREFNRVLDQVKPTPAQEQAMLDRLLTKQEAVKPMKYMKKMTAVIAAAALLVMACAFTVATGMDQRILAYFGGTEEDAQLLAPGFMAVDLTSTAQNGAKVHISQVYSDRRNMVLAGEMTAADGTALDQADYRFENWNLRPRGTDGTEPGGGYGSFSIYGGDEIWTDEDPEDNTLSFLLVYNYAAGNWDADSAELTWAEDIDRFELTLENLTGWTDADDPASVVVPGEWAFEIPLSGKDFGWTVVPEQSIELGEGAVQVAEIYLSPVGLSVRLANENGKLADLVHTWQAQENSGIPWGDSVVLRDQNGKIIQGNVPYSQCSSYTGQMLFNFDEIYDPAQFQGGTVTIMGRSFSLDSLQPVADETNAQSPEPGAS